MKPPLCVVCYRSHRSHPELKFTPVTFARTAVDEGWYKRAESSPGFVGQPPNVEWFCEDHVERGQAMAAMPLEDAIAAIGADFQSSHGQGSPDSHRPPTGLQGWLRRLGRVLHR